MKYPTNDSLQHIDNAFLQFKALYRARLIKNYRYTESRTVYWWDRGLVKFIQLLRVPEKAHLELWVGAYRLAVPLLNFWTVYLHVPSDFSKKLTEVRESTQQAELGTWLKTARQELEPLNYREVQAGETSRTVLRNFLIPENILSLVLLLGIVGAGVYLVFRFPEQRLLVATLATILLGGIYAMFGRAPG